jgi:hypothetical protein
MAFSPVHTIRGSLGYVGTHTSLLVAGVGLMLLQQYVWALNIARQGYGPYYATSWIETVSAVVVVIDLIILRWAVRASRGETGSSRWFGQLRFLDSTSWC